MKAHCTANKQGGSIARVVPSHGKNGPKSEPLTVDTVIHRRNFEPSRRARVLGQLLGGTDWLHCRVNIVMLYMRVVWWESSAFVFVPMLSEIGAFSAKVHHTFFFRYGLERPATI